MKRAHDVLFTQVKNYWASVMHCFFWLLNKQVDNNKLIYWRKKMEHPL